MTKVDNISKLITQENLENATPLIGKSGGRYFTIQEINVNYKTLISIVYSRANEKNVDKAEIKELYQKVINLNEKANKLLEEKSKESFKIDILTKIRRFFGNLFSNRKKQIEFLDGFTGIKLQNNEQSSSTREDIENVKKMIKEGKADVAINGFQPVHHAAKMGHLESLKLLINEQNINAQDNEGYTPLHYAAFCGTQKAIQFLLDKGANPEISSKDGNLPIHMAFVRHVASAEAQTEVYSLLISKTQNIDSQDNSGISVLARACRANNKDFVKALLENGAKPNKPNKFNELPLHEAAKREFLDIVKLLVEKMTPDEINFKDKEGKTALNRAQEGTGADKDAVVQLLIAKVAK